MEMQNSKIWGTIGKIAVVVTIILTTIQIINSLKGTDAEYNCDINVEKQEYETSPIYYKEFDNLADYYAISNLINIGVISLDNNLQYVIDSLKQHNIEFFSFEHWQRKAKQKLPIQDYAHLVIFNIENVGSKPLENIILETPEIEGYYKVVLPDNTYVTGSFKDRILLPQLSPSYKFRVKIWTSYFNDFQVRDMKVAHKFGSFAITQNVYYTGVWDYLDSNPGLYFLVVFGLPICVLFLILTLLHNKGILKIF